MELLSDKVKLGATKFAQRASDIPFAIMEFLMRGLEHCKFIAVKDENPKQHCSLDWNY